MPAWPSLLLFKQGGKRLFFNLFFSYSINVLLLYLRVISVYVGVADWMLGFYAET